MLFWRIRKIGLFHEITGLSKLLRNFFELFEYKYIFGKNLIIFSRNLLKERNWVFVTNSGFLIPISFQPSAVGL